MPDSTKPREILNVLKERDSVNTTGIRSIYNAIYKHKEVKRGGLNPIQHLLEQLISKRYLYAFMTNPETNEITNILWVHPKSMELFVNFSIVLIIDATYKTNEYRIPLLEAVGITSTMQTYSLMFAYLANERSDQLTWALGTLKNLMIEKGAVMPSVLNVVKYCSPILGSEMKRFLMSWQSLIMSSTPEAYQQKWHILVGEFKSYPRATKYLWKTWLRPYKERAESAHDRLKLYLGDTMSSLDTFFAKIHKMLRIQFSAIQKSFERSLNILHHKQRTYYIFNDVICQISLEALEFINEQLQYADTASPFIAGYCDCTIKVTHGLPCMHDLANYRSLCIPIPLRDIDSHWTRLYMHADRQAADDPRSDRTSEVFELLQGMDPSARDNMINRIIDMADPSNSTVRSPAYNTEYKGRPAGRNEQSKRRIPSILESYSSGSKGASNLTPDTQVTLPAANSRVRKNQPPTPPIFDPFIQELPEAY
ncbi:uncharacterized protein LOC130749908 [Actinidia eriantha]|uniref:uncharacterized protein LOC130749908 n=1 Tax=Actinidia eriantha TaxID=165200 RepID=UPI002590C881|nr:uncharacterized protein LOC130749908 [Actinidia eriantha]